MKETLIKREFNFYELLSNAVRGDNFKDILEEYDIVFYIHGGGFLAQSVESSVGFLSDLAKDIPCIVFALDYKLAPTNKIEDIVKECYKAYTSLINNLPALFSIKPRKIIISGDSAGGFLSLNLTNDLIRNKNRVPDGLILIYPCTRIYFREMCPSHLLALTDSMIDTPFLTQLMNITMDLDLYYKGKLNLNDRYNFQLTPSHILKQFPKTFIIIGTNDPIRDESYRLTDFLLTHKVPVELREFLYFPHGFMNITSLVDKYYMKGLTQMKEYAAGIFQQKKENSSAVTNDD